MGVEDWKMNGEKAPIRGNRENWIKIIEECTRDLHDRVDVQQNLLLTILGKMKGPPPIDPCSTPDCPHKKLFCRVLLETINALEETKKSFKSKRLEELRKRLTDLLIETA